MNKIFKFIIFSCLVTLFLAFSVSAQLKNRKTPKTKKPVEVKTAETPAVEIVPAEMPVKKNERPETANSEPQKKNQAQRNLSVSKKGQPSFPYIYEFSQPNFIVSRMIIKHNETGKGEIIFEKKDMDEAATDPLDLSPVSLEKINNLFNALNFLDSTEDYQSPARDYGHLGNYKITLKKDGRERTAKYNWSENKDAKALADEYRKIGEQYVWMFDIIVARENQPLEAPGLMNKLDSLIRRNEISDPAQMIPMLKDLSSDERIPLIARNHATRIIKNIEKNK